MKLLFTLRSSDAISYHEPRQAISIDWLNFCQQFEITPILIPYGIASYEAYFELNPAGLVLTGGDDVGLLSHETPDPQPTPRDCSEYQLIALALRQQLPILGVCRGMQLLNVYFGGGLVRQLQANHTKPHEITFAQNIGPYQKGHKVEVNSFHQQGIYDEHLAKDFMAVAHSADGCIEYIEHKTLPVTGVLWHPERLNHAAAKLDHFIIHNRFKK